MINLYNLCTDFVKFADMALPYRDQRHLYLRFEGLEYTNADIADFGERLGKIYERGVHRVHVFDFRGLTDLMAKGFEVRGLLVHELILEFFSTFRFGEAVLDLDTVGALQFQLGEAASARQIPDKGDLSAYWRGITSEGDFLGMTSSYTTIRDPMLRLCHSLIACSIAGRSQSTEKVTVTDLFYLRGMDVGSVNILLFFGKGLTVIVRDLLVIDMAEKVRLHICEELDDTWAWLAPGPERQHDAAAGALEVAPVHAPQLPPAVGPAKTLPQRVARLEEEVYGLRGSMAEQRDVLDSMAYDFSRFTTWMVSSLSLMMDHARVRYKPGSVDIWRWQWWLYEVRGSEKEPMIGARQVAGLTAGNDEVRIRANDWQ
ncbi:hypothetical protein Tco_0320709 [Tanacetum coccineum]